MQAMLPPPFSRALVLTGPTGSGKSSLALELAPRLNAEIVAMDSMTLYRGMDIGTAKPTPQDRERVPHHLLDMLDPWQSASVAWWLDKAARCVEDIEARGKRPLFVGGTPLYLKALLFGLFEGPPADIALRRRLTEEARSEGGDTLHRRLAQIDPAAAARLHPNDTRRIIRALEVWELTGAPISQWQRQWPVVGRQSSGDSGQDSALVEGTVPAILCLDRPRPELYGRINRRVEEMFAAGLVEEARSLRAAPRGLSDQAAQALGYKEVLAHLDAKADLAQTVALVQTRTRNFAKRQLTWFRRLPGCTRATSAFPFLQSWGGRG
jgi:tRNA dimethylallyltransferase